MKKAGYLKISQESKHIMDLLLGQLINDKVDNKLLA